VKKSSQSRRLMKQKKLEKKRKELGFGNDDDFESGSSNPVEEQESISRISDSAEYFSGQMFLKILSKIVFFKSYQIIVYYNL
jgi:hypothetical protein